MVELACQSCIARRIAANEVPRVKSHLLLLISFFCLAATAIDIAAQPPTAPVDGLREHTPSSYALINVRIVPEPGKVIEKGTIVLKEGVIVAVGADAVVPADARLVDLPGKTVYAGFIDPFTEMAVLPQVRRSGA